MNEITKNLKRHIEEHIKANYDYTSKITTKKITKTTKGYQLIEIDINIKSTNYEELKQE